MRSTKITGRRHSPPPMWFNSFAFLLFLALVLIVYSVLGHRERNRWLLLCSYYFYACWDWRFLGLIGFTTLFEYTSASLIHGSKSAAFRKACVTASILVELGILGTFKYLGFFVAELHVLTTSIGFEALVPASINIMLPVGISFFTFQALSYTIDVYRGKVEPSSGLLDFGLYIAFFPQLVAGPIERSSHLLPQIQKVRPLLSEQRFQEGLYHILSGFFKKLVVADNMAWLANHIFATTDPDSLRASEVLVGTYAFAFQIYGDFSGYSSIAIGISKWLGFDLMENFRRPYFSSNPQEFWSRWHISLSTWLKDYLYIPLGGNRHSRSSTYRNLMVTMMIGGLWHGAAWTFLVWGGLHGAWLVAHRLWSETQWKRSLDTIPCVKPFFWLISFHLICLSWLCFRSEDLDQLRTLSRIVLSGGWEFTNYVSTASSLLLFFLAPWMAFEAWLESANRELYLLEVHWVARTAVYAYLIAMILLFPPPITTEFIYFRF